CVGAATTAVARRERPSPGTCSQEMRSSGPAAVEDAGGAAVCAAERMVDDDVPGARHRAGALEPARQRPTESVLDAGEIVERALDAAGRRAVDLPAAAAVRAGPHVRATLDEPPRRGESQHEPIEDVDLVLGGGAPEALVEVVGTEQLAPEIEAAHERLRRIPA